MSFKLINTSATFQELINHVLYNHLNEFIITYLNNILIYFKNKKNHKKHVKKVLRKLQEKKLYFKSEKCKFYKQWVKYLEHIIITEKLEMNSEKIKAMIKFLTLKCVKNIQTFQELAKYYWKFITDFVSITASLINLLRKDKSFKWTESQKQAFKKIKEKFKKKSILIHFNYKKSAIINADVSKKAMRAWLQQINN